MDVVFYCGLILVSLLTLCLLKLLSNKTNLKGSGQSSTPPLPPGNLGLPLVGESIEFLSFLRAGVSEKFVYHRMSRYSNDVFKTSLIGKPTAVVCGSGGSMFLFKNDNKLVRQWWPLGLNTILSPSRQSPFPLKTVILMFFRGDYLKKQVPIIDRLAKKHLETKWYGCQEVTVLPLAMDFAFTLACSLTLSMEKTESIEKLEALIGNIIGGFLQLRINLPGTRYNRALKAWDAARKQVAEIVARRRGRTEGGFQDTLSSLLAAIHDSGEEMSDEDVADRLIGLLISAHDTSYVLIAMIFKYLGKHPDVYDAVLQENREMSATKKGGCGGEERCSLLNWEDVQKLKCTWNVVKEVMRLCPPAQGLLREALVDFSYAGFHIPKGWKLFLSIKAIHKDPNYFPEPDKFDPTRFEGNGPLPNTYMPFGGGLNMCPGKSFAQALVLVFIHNAVTRFKWELLLDSDEQLLVDPVPRPTSGIPVRLYPHPTQPTNN